MSKRFSDTDKYKKPFIRALKGPYKLLWDYICLNCNHAGIWIADFEIAQICIGKDMPVNPEEAVAAFNEKEEKVVVLNGGSKWFIKDFVIFQYGQLNEKNRVHRSVIFELQKYDLLCSLNIKISPLEAPYVGAKDKDKDKDKDKEGCGEKKAHRKFKPVLVEEESC